MGRGCSPSSIRARARGRGVVLGLFGLVFLGAACSDDEAPGQAVESTSADDVQRRSGLPIEDILILGAENQVVAWERVGDLVEQCMRERGFDYDVPPPSARLSDYSLRVRYGALEGIDVATWGYRDPDAIERREELERTNANAEPMSDEALAALRGGTPVDEGAPDGVDGSAPRDDCSSRARREVFGSSVGVAALPGYDELVQLQLDSSDRLYASEDGIRAVRDWSDCMRAQGYAFEHWWEPSASFAPSPASAEDISEEERRTATADAACRRTTDLEQRLFEAESEIQTAMLADIADVVATYRTATDDLRSD